MPDENYRLFVSEDRRMLVRLWDGQNEVEVCVRENEGAVWGPPVVLEEER